MTGLYFPRRWPRPDRTAFGPRSEDGFEKVARQFGEYLDGDRRNPVCIIIPCHRVVGATGRLTGYAGSLDRKRTLLEIEHAGALGAGRALSARLR